MPSVASDGLTSHFNCNVFPGFNVIQYSPASSSHTVLFVIDKLSQVTITLKLHVAITVPVDSDFASITVFPGLTAVIFPFWSIRAILLFWLLHSTSLFVAFSGEIVAVNVAVSPFFKTSCVLSNVICLTGIGFTLMVKDAVLFSLFTSIVCFPIFIIS